MGSGQGTHEQVTTAKVVFRPAAVTELEDARLWYEARRPGLGDDFVDCIDLALLRVASEPLAHARVHGDIRRVLVRRFPYAIFHIAESDRVVVLAVFHASRDPAVWQGRR